MRKQRKQDLKNIVRYIRLNRNETIEEMANRLNYSKSLISAIENGKREITKYLVLRFYEVYKDLSYDEKLILHDTYLLQSAKKIFHEMKVANNFVSKANLISDLDIKLMNDNYEEMKIDIAEMKIRLNDALENLYKYGNALINNEGSRSSADILFS